MSWPTARTSCWGNKFVIAFDLRHLDARVILLSVPRSDRVPPILRLMTAQAALGGVVIPWDFGFRHEDEEFLDVASMRRHSREGVADGSSRKGWQRASSRRSRASCAVRRDASWGWVKALARR